MFWYKYVISCRIIFITIIILYGGIYMPLLYLSKVNLNSKIYDIYDKKLN